MKPNLKEGEDYMIVDENIFNYLVKKYQCNNPVQRIGILINEDTEEAIVEIYLKPIQIFPIPNETFFKFTRPKTVLISRNENISALASKIKTVLSYYVYTVLKDRSLMITDVRLWKSLINNVEEIQKNVDKKYKNYTHVKIDATPLNISETDKNKTIEDANIADDDIIVVETQKPNK